MLKSLANIRPDEQIALGDNLYCSCSKSGVKTFYMRKRINGVQVVKKIGIYPKTTIKQARAFIKNFSTEQLGSEPPIVKPKKALTFGAIYDEWLEFKLKQVKDKKSITSRSYYLLQEFEQQEFKSIQVLQVANFLKRLTKQGTQKLETAKRAVIYLKQIEAFAVNSGYVSSYKFTNIGKVIPSPRKINRASVHHSKLPWVFSILKKECVSSPIILDLFLIACYTLLRPSEYVSLKFEYIKSDRIVIPADVMKMKKEHELPISTQLSALIEKLKAYNSSEYLFPSKNKYAKHVSIESFEVFLRRHGFKNILVPHGIRSIGRTFMQEHDIDYFVSEMCLAHTVGTDVFRTYARSTLFDQRAKAMQAWCDYVEKCFKEA